MDKTVSTHLHEARPFRRNALASTLAPTVHRKTVEVVLKCDSKGTEEAVIERLETVHNDEYEIGVIHADIGDVSKSDIDMAMTGSRLVIGFNVGIMPKMEQFSKEHGVEVRFYDVIYRLTEDLQAILDSLIEPDEPETVTGQAKIIALFKGGRKDTIIGCQVMNGKLSVGDSFRIISAMGPIYEGTIESMHIEKDAVTEGKRGENVGIKVGEFRKAKVGDLVECYEKPKRQGKKPWNPRGGIHRLVQ